MFHLHAPPSQGRFWLLKKEACDEGTVSPQTINLPRMTLEHNPPWSYQHVSLFQNYCNASENFPFYYSTIKVKTLSYMIFWQTMTQTLFRYMQAENTRLKITKYIHIRGVFKTQSNINDGALFQKQLTVISRQLFWQKSSIVDVWLAYKYASAYYI